MKFTTTVKNISQKIALGFLAAVLFFSVLAPLAHAATVNVWPDSIGGDAADSLSDLTADDAPALGTFDPDTAGNVTADDNVYTVDTAAGNDELLVTSFDTSAIPAGSTINGAVLHLEYGVQDSYGGSNSIQYLNGSSVMTDTTITPTDISDWSGDTTYDIYTNDSTAVDTLDEITAMDIGYINDDGQSADAVHFDYIYMAVDYTAPSITISGTVYSDQGTTAITSGPTVNLVIGTSTPSVWSTTANGSGVYTFTDVPITELPLPIGVYVDASTTLRAYTMTKIASSTAGNITDLDLYQDHLTVRYETDVTSISIDDMSFYDKNDDSDVTFVADGLYDAWIAEYSTSILDISGQETTARDMIFNDDGTILYIIGQDGDDINAYPLPVAYDINSYTSGASIALSVSSEETFPTDMMFNNNGTILYVMGVFGADINAYPLPTAYDIGSYVSGTSVALDVSGQDTAPRSFLFNNDGTVLYVLGFDGLDINAYPLDTAYDISSYTSGTSVVLSVSGQEASPRDMIFNNDGTILFVIGSSADTLFAYNLSTPYDISTGSYGGFSLGMTSEDSLPASMLFNDDGTVLYMLGSNDNDINVYNITPSLNVDPNTKLYVEQSKTFEAGGSITIKGNAGSGVDGSLELATSSTFSTSYRVTLAGSLDVGNGATYSSTHASGTTFNATTTGKTVSGDLDDIGVVNFNGGGGGWTFTSAATTSDFTITAGSVTAPDSTLTIEGDYENNSVFSNNSGQIIFASTTSKTISGSLTGSNALNNVLISEGTVTFSTSTTITGNYTNNGTVNFADTATTTFSGTNKTLSGNLTGDSALNNILITGSTTFLANASTSNLTISSGGSVIAPASLSIAGDYTNNGTFSQSSGVVYINGANKQTLSGTMTGGSSFNNLVINGYGNTVFADNASTTDLTATNGLLDSHQTWDPADVNIMDFPKSVKVVGDYAYVAGYTSDNFAIVDLSSTTNPVTAGVWDPNNTTVMNGSYDVDVAGNYAYMVGNLSDNLVIIDISSSTNPTLAGNYDPNDTNIIESPSSVKVVGNYAYVVGDTSNNLVIIDISSSTNPTLAGNYDPNDTTIINYPSSVKVVGNYAYVAGAASGNLVIIDISSSTNPTLAASWDPNDLNIMGAPYAVDVVGDHAYLPGYASQNLVIIDISSSTNPTLLGEWDSYDEVEIDNIFVNDDYAYLVNGATGVRGVIVIDISSSTNPVYLDHIRDTSSTTHAYEGIDIAEGYLYTLSTIWDDLLVFSTGLVEFSSQVTVAGSYSNTVRIGDNSGKIYLTGTGENVSDTNGIMPDVSVSGSYTVSGDLEVNNLSIESSGSLVGSDGSLRVFGDYQNDGSFTSSGGKVYVYGTAGGSMTSTSAFNDLFLTGTTNKILPTQASTTNLTVVGLPDVVGSVVISDEVTFSAASDVFVQGDYAYLTGLLTSDNLAIVDISSSTNPVTTGTWDPVSVSEMDAPRSVFVQGDYAYVVGGLVGGSYNAFSVIDISSSTNPTLAGNWNTTDTGATGILSGPESVYIAGSYAYVSSYGSDNLLIFDISSSTNPLQVGNYDPGDANILNGPKDVKVAGDYAYVTGLISDNVLIIDISSSTNPTLAGNYDPNDLDVLNTPYTIEVVESYAYVIGRDSDNVLIIDISSSTNPTLAGNYDPNDTDIFEYPVGIEIDGTFAYVVNELSNTLVVFDISSSTNPVYLFSKDLNNSTRRIGADAVKLAGDYLYVNFYDSDSLVILDKNNLTVSGGSELTVNGELKNNSTLVAPSTLYLGEDYSNSGTFTHNSGEIIFSGTSQQVATGTMTGVSQFYDLTITNTSGTGSNSRSVIFGAPVTATGTMTMVASTSAEFPARATSSFGSIDWQGSANSPVWLRSTATGTQWILEVPGSQVNVSYVDVKDSDATPTSGGINPDANSIDSGNNTNWNFSEPYVPNGFSISGTLYESDGSTPITTGKTIMAAVGTSTISLHSTTTDASGNFTLDGIATSTLGAFATTSAAGNNDVWRGVTYGEGLFVAVAACESGGGSDDCIMTSEDGVTWTTRSITPSTPSFPPALTSVEYGEGRFVAAGFTNTDDTVWSSEDGINWTIRDGYGDWNDIAYGNGKFVAVGQNAGTMDSEDGITWTTRTVAGNDDAWTSVAYGEDTFVAVADCEFGGDCVMYSTDYGVTWTTGTIAGNNDRWSRVVYGNGRFVAVTLSGSDSAYSDDGITWSTASNPSAARSLVYANGLFIAAGENENLSTSTNGVSWSSSSHLGNNDFWRDAVYAEGKVVFVGSNGDRVSYADAGFGESSPITLWVDNDTVDATTLTTGANSVSAITGIDLYQDTVRLEHASTSGSFYLDRDYLYDSEDDTDILFIATSSTTTVNANLDISANTTLFAPYELEVFGDVNINGDIKHEKGTVYLTGGDQTLTTTATTTFYTVEAATTSARTLTFTAGQEYVFKDELTLTGVSGNLTSLRSTSDGLEYYFNPYATVTVSYLNVKDSNNISATTTSIECSSTCVNSGNNTGWNLPAQVTANGSSTISNHVATQVTNAFNFQNKTNEVLYAFKLTPNSGNGTVTSMTIGISGSKDVDTNDFSNIKLLRDLDNDATYDVSDVQVGGVGTMTINGQIGSIVFTTDFLATTSQNYILVADWNVPDKGSHFTLELATGGVVMIDSDGAMDIYGSVDSVQHNRNNRGGGGSSAPIGGSAPAGDGDVGGGSEGGGGGDDAIDTNTGGDTIGSSPDFNWPTANSGSWNNAANAYDQTDGTYATTSSATSNQFTNYNDTVPNGDTIQGIAVKLELSGTSEAGDINVELSWNGGSNWTSVKTTPTLTTTDAVVTLGGPSDNWGRTWSPSEFTNGNFSVRLTGNPSSNEIRVDAIQVRVYHQASGGGGGGGGAL